MVSAEEDPAAEASGRHEPTAGTASRCSNALLQVGTAVDKGERGERLRLGPLFRRLCCRPGGLIPDGVS